MWRQCGQSSHIVSSAGTNSMGVFTFTQGQWTTQHTMTRLDKKKKSWNLRLSFRWELVMTGEREREREREMMEFKSPPFSKDAFQIWMLAVWPKQCESHSRRWKEGREKGMRTKAETNVTEVLLTEKEGGGESYTRLHFAPSVEKNNCKTDFWAQ